MVEDELRSELRGAGLDPSAEFKARMDQEFDDALAGRRVLGVTAPSPGTPRRAGWMWPVIGAAAACIALAVAVTVGNDPDVVAPATTDVTPEPTNQPTTVPVPDALMEVLNGSLFGMRIGDIVDVTETIARIDALDFGPHTYDSGWYRVPDDPSIDSCYDDQEYRGVMWGDVLIIFNGSDSSAEVMRWAVGDHASMDEVFFLGEEVPTPDRSNDIVSVEGIRVGSDAGALQPPEFDVPIDSGDGRLVFGVTDIGPQDGSLPQPFVKVYASGEQVSGILADTGRC
ncbi:MAG: hypothetical protein HY828_19245 [Actinobacteria bacterium]|nr:hypothetical protein [Actinomycetota bacterium]